MSKQEKPGEVENVSLNKEPQSRDKFSHLDLPREWSLVRFGRICKVQGGFAFKSNNYKKHGIPLVRISNLQNGEVQFDSDTVYLSEEKLKEHPEFILNRGDTLIALSGATTGKMATFDLDVPALLNQRVGRFKLVSDCQCDEKFIKWLVVYIRATVLKNAYGAAQPNISTSQVEDIEVPLPSIPEQQRIVEEIEKQFTRLEAGVSALKRMQANLKRYRASVLKAACEGRLVPTEAELARQEGHTYEPADVLLQRIIYERCKNVNVTSRKETKKQKSTSGDDHQMIDRSSLAKLPEGWTWATVEQLNPTGRPCTYGVLQPGGHIETGVPIVRVGDVNNGKVDLSNIKCISPQIAARYPRTKLHGGEVVISLVGAIGRTAVVPESLVGGNTARAIGVIPLSNQVNAHWVEVWFRNPEMVTAMTMKAHEVARKTLNLEDVRSASVALPPFAEQHRIVSEVERRLSVIDELESVVTANLKRAERLRQAILHKAFTGQLV